MNELKRNPVEALDNPRAANHPAFMPSSSDAEEEDKNKKATTKKKPGRKPSEAVAASKRTAQNRAAQRAFRERKEKYLNDLEERVKELEQLAGSGSNLELLDENKKLKEQIAALQNENSALKDMKFTFDFPVVNAPTDSKAPESNQSSTSLTGSSPLSSTPLSPFPETGMGGAAFPLFPAVQDILTLPNPTYPISPLSETSRNPSASPSFGSAELFGQDHGAFQPILGPTILPQDTSNLQQYRDAAGVTEADIMYVPDSQPLLEDDIDELLNTAGLSPVLNPLDTPSNVEDSNDQGEPLELSEMDSQLKEQVQRVVGTDPVVLNDLCEMFSSKASCTEFVKMKEKIAIAIIKEDSNSVLDLVKQAKVVEQCD